MGGGVLGVALLVWASLAVPSAQSSPECSSPPCSTCGWTREVGEETHGTLTVGFFETKLQLEGQFHNHKKADNVPIVFLNGQAQAAIISVSSNGHDFFGLVDMPLHGIDIVTLGLVARDCEILELHGARLFSKLYRFPNVREYFVDELLIPTATAVAAPSPSSFVEDAENSTRLEILSPSHWQQFEPGEIEVELRCSHCQRHHIWCYFQGRGTPFVDSEKTRDADGTIMGAKLFEFTKPGINKIACCATDMYHKILAVDYVIVETTAIPLPPGEFVKLFESRLSKDKLITSGSRRRTVKSLLRSLDVTCQKHTDLLQYCAPNCVTVEVGAQDGNNTFGLARASKKIYSLEADQIWSQSIRDNFAARADEFGDTSVVFLNAAASNVTGEHNTWDGNSMINLHRELEPPRDRTIIPTVRLDEIINEHVDFMLLDVEGHEWHLLLGAEGLIRKHGVDAIMLEYFPSMLYKNGVDPAHLLSWLYDLGYTCFDCNNHPKSDVRGQPRDILMFDATMFPFPGRAWHTDQDGREYEWYISDWTDILCLA